MMRGRGASRRLELRLTDAELQDLRLAAKRAGLAVATYVRTEALKKARDQGDD